MKARLAGCSGSFSTIGIPASPASRTSRMDRNLRQHPRALLHRELRPAARAEQFVALAAIGADEIAHVLDHAENRAVQLVEHRDRPRRVEQRHVLRRGDDHRAVERDLLRERELRIAGAGRQIDDQKILRAPQRVLEKWRTAPITIGPRQMTGDLSVRKKPIEISFTP